MDFIKNVGLNSGFCYKALISVELLARVIDIRLCSMSHVEYVLSVGQLSSQTS